MYRSITTVLLLACSILAGCAGTTTSAGRAASAPREPAGLLDGASYDVTLSIPGKAPETETLVFAGGRFESTACTAKGFPRWTPYRADAQEGAVAFNVSTRHPRGTTVEWNGTVHGDTIEGTADITLDGSRLPGTFRGTVR